MARGTTIEFTLTGPAYGTALVAQDDSVWIAIHPRWWDTASWLWWWLCPSDRKIQVRLNVSDGTGGSVCIRSRAVRVAKRYVRVSGMPQLTRETFR